MQIPEQCSFECSVNSLRHHELLWPKNDEVSKLFNQISELDPKNLNKDVEWGYNMCIMIKYTIYQPYNHRIKFEFYDGCYPGYPHLEAIIDCDRDTYRAHMNQTIQKVEYTSMSDDSNPVYMEDLGEPP